MRINKINITNYRQFRNFKINFNKKNNLDLNIIIGRNGTGKTNLLNAINWCLYNDEPHLSIPSQQMPLLNVKSIKEPLNKDEISAIVEIWVEDEDRVYIFRRKANYRDNRNELIPTQKTNILEVEIHNIKDDGNTDIRILSGEESKEFIERFIPKNIRDFYFFDGERLNKYFEESIGQNIRNAIFIISQIDLLEKVENKIDSFLRELTKQAGKYNVKIEEKQNNLNEVKDNIKNTEIEIEDSKKKISEAKEIIRKCIDELNKFPDVEKLEEDRNELKKELIVDRKHFNEKIKEKEELLFEYGIILMLLPAIIESVNIIDYKREKKEIPPNVNKNLLEDIIKNNFCSVCKRPLNETAKIEVINLLNDIKLSSEIGNQLLLIEHPLKQFKDKVNNFKKKRDKITEEVEYFKNNINENEKKIANIDSKLIGYNTEKIKKYANTRKTFEQTHDYNLKVLGILTNRKEEYIKKKKSLEFEINEELGKAEKSEKIRKGIVFFNKALSVITEAKENIMNKTREEIENETRNNFFSFIWKKETFRDVDIDENYAVNLIHSLGYECLGSTGAAEKQLLALSFTLAIHKISGFSAPILIDTPVGRISDENRKNFGKVFSEISDNKQVVLLFTPDEYSENISSILNKKASNMYETKLSEDELETKLEVL